MRIPPAAHLPLVAVLCLTCRAGAATYTENGDAGDQIATAQEIGSAMPGTSLTEISGMLTLTNNVSEVDIYRIDISDTSLFSATMPLSPGVNNFDSQLMIFNASGVGIVANDDNPSNGNPQASIPAGSLSAEAPGIYYLLVDGSGEYPVDSTSHLIFPNYQDGTGTTNSTDVVAAESAMPLAGYTGNSGEGGNYGIDLTGAEFETVPEASSAETLACGVLGWAGYKVLIRRRRHASPGTEA